MGIVMANIAAFLAMVAIVIGLAIANRNNHGDH